MSVGVSRLATARTDESGSDVRLERAAPELRR